ncbi:PorV/PorQ family protein [candidate division KSB1 bacterium]|nr:PorV/PorQ family protein [candidate division KSB1 bacterium]
MKKYGIVLFASLFLVVLSSTALAQEFQKIGTTGFVFLELPVTARSVAIGETGITLVDAGAEGLFLNPASIALSKSRFAFTASHADWYVETTHQAIGMIYQIPLFGTIGIQSIYFDFGEIERTINPSQDQTGSYVSLGNYSAGAYALGLTYARSLTDKFSFGASIKYVRETIADYSADNFITDIGFLYLSGFGSLRIGAALQSFGLEAKYADEKFKMPQQLKMGMSGEILGSLDGPHRLTLLAEAVHPNDADERIHIGTESVIAHSFVLRAGYKFGYDDEDLCLGGGLKFLALGTKVRFDFSYMNHDRLDTTIRYTLATEF